MGCVAPGEEEKKCHRAEFCLREQILYKQQRAYRFSEQFENISLPYNTVMILFLKHSPAYYLYALASYPSEIYEIFKYSTMIEIH